MQADPTEMAEREFDFTRLLSPKSAVFIGGGEAARALEETIGLGFKGDVWAVNPFKETLAGVPCYKHIDDLPGVPDVAFLAIPPEPSIEAVELLAKIGCGGVICYASGFAEIGEIGVDRQNRLLAAAGSMPVVGPNSYGCLNLLDGLVLWPDVHGAERSEKGVAIIMQSGNITVSMSNQDRSVPLAILFSVGNQAQIGIAELTRALVQDPRITAVGLHVEAIGNIRAFSEAALLAAVHKTPIVALKTGKSQKGAEVALSHTSSLAGSAAAYEALFDRLGVVSVDTLPKMMETLKFLSSHPSLPGKRIVSMSCSGGEAGLVADLTEEMGIETPAFSKADQATLYDVLGDKVSIDNPLDYHTYIWGDEEKLTACYTAALKSDVDAGIIVVDFPKRTTGAYFGWREAENAIIAAAQASGRPTALVSTLHEGIPAVNRNRLMQGGVVPMLGLEEALLAIRSAGEVGEAWRDGITLPIEAPALLHGQVVTVDEYRSKKMLTACGLSVPEGALVRSATEAVAAAKSLGYPVVLKAVSSTLAHKTEAGGVALNLADGDAVQAAFDRMAGLADTFLVERMMAGVVGELIVGITREPGIGPVLLIGAGGVTAEIIKDSVLLTLPVDDKAIRQAIGRLKTSPLLMGYRGRPEGDIDAAVDAIKAIAEFATEKGGSLVELDVNPLMVLEKGKGAVAADALIRLIGA
ncbi:MAG: acetate--CoA ligase family protein [Alphaproteobacteria bacterium]